MCRLRAESEPRMMMTATEIVTCPFCDLDDQRVFHEDSLMRCIWDGFPVSEGHAGNAAALESVKKSPHSKESVAEV